MELEYRTGSSLRPPYPFGILYAGMFLRRTISAPRLMVPAASEELFEVEAEVKSTGEEAG